VQPFKTHRVLAVAARAAWALEDLADELPYAPSDDREALQAGIDFESWLLESCRYALPAARTGQNGPF
jgi:hypothetical protein